MNQQTTRHQVLTRLAAVPVAAGALAVLPSGAAAQTTEPETGTNEPTTTALAPLPQTVTLDNRLQVLLDSAVPGTAGPGRG